MTWNVLNSQTSENILHWAFQSKTTRRITHSLHGVHQCRFRISSLTRRKLGGASLPAGARGCSHAETHSNSRRSWLGYPCNATSIQDWEPKRVQPGSGWAGLPSLYSNIGISYCSPCPSHLFWLKYQKTVKKGNISVSRERFKLKQNKPRITLCDLTFTCNFSYEYFRLFATKMLIYTL